MSTDGENLRLTRRLFERWNSGEHGIDPELTDSEVELHTALSSTRTARTRVTTAFARVSPRSRASSRRGASSSMS